MKIKEIADLLNGKIIGDINYETESDNAFASDLMSDVLRLTTPCAMLITGLCNMQTIRTAEMADIKVIILARGKIADEEMIEQASVNDIIIIETGYSLFKVSGILYNYGVQPIY
ncbi:MAG: hypothetical protein J5701_06745 [Bacteroidales bacterium]|nr:hypothetical protein [Bacteroidales bacterium]